MKKVLITGFDPFDKEPINPAYEAVKLIPDVIADAKIIKIEIPTVFHRSIDELKKAMEEVKPDYVFCIGQAGGRFQVTPERVAINVDDARIKDNEGNQPIDEAIFLDGAPAYFTKLPIKAIVSEIKKANIPSGVSNTAGTYVCNHLMYGLLYLIDKNKEFEHVIGGFIHVPYATEQVIDKPDKPSLTLTQIAKALEIAIATTLKHEQDLHLQGGALQ